MNDRTTTAAYADKQAQVIIQRPACTRQVSESGVTLQVALPGVRKEDLKLTLNQSILQLEANRTAGVPDDWKAHTNHPEKVSYEIGFELDAKLDGGNVRAGLENGVLTLYIPVREEAKARNILVN
jgi:HSP20 family protein